MGTKLEDIVEVVISRETARISTQSFGIPLILGPFSHKSGRVYTYGSPEEVLEDGFLESSDVYKAALKLYSQDDVSPEEFKVGRKLENVNAKQTITLSLTPDSGSFKVKIGADTSALINFDDSAVEIKAIIEALAGVAEGTVTGTPIAKLITIEFTGADAAKSFATIVIVDNTLKAGLVDVSAEVTVIQYGSAVETWTAALAAVRAIDDDWFCLISTTHTKSDILALAAVIETLVKMYAAATLDANVKTDATDDVASALKVLGYDKTFIIWSDDAANFPEGAWVGGNLPKDPGSVTWKFKTLGGIIPDVLTTDEVTHLKAKNANFYETVGGMGVVTGEGIVASGEFIDIMHGSMWLQTRMAERVFSRLASTDKVPLTNAGIELIATEVRAQLNEADDATGVGLIRKDTIAMDVPDISDISSADKALRFLNGIKFSANFAGAVHKVRLVGKLSV